MPTRILSDLCSLSAKQNNHGEGSHWVIEVRGGGEKLADRLDFGAHGMIAIVGASEDDTSEGIHELSDVFVIVMIAGQTFLIVTRYPKIGRNCVTRRIDEKGSGRSRCSGNTVL
jgi:hypothetical protein